MPRRWPAKTSACWRGWPEMAITSDEFTATISTLLEVLPMQRRLTEAGLVMLWETFPLTAKQQLTGGILRFCASQRMLDPAPPKELAPHLSLLRYAYPLEADRPVVERGLRPDLRQRMAEPDRFHDPAPAREERQAASDRAPRLPGNSKPWHPDRLTADQRRAHVLRVAESARRVIAQGPDERTWTSAQLQQGAWWFGRALQGFWLLEVDDGGIAKAWLARNPAWAERLIEEALAGTAPQLPPAEGLAVAFSAIGTGGREVA